MGNPVRIGFAGTDARTLHTALMVSNSQGQTPSRSYKGVLIRGTPSMQHIAHHIMEWDIGFIATEDNSAGSYASAMAAAFENGEIDYAVPMPESLILNGIVDMLGEKGYGGRLAGLTREGAFIEGDKIRCKEFCKKAGIPVSDNWCVVDAGSFSEVSSAVLSYIHTYGGAVLKFPYSAGGKGARVILDTWDLRQVYDGLMQDYKKSYKKMFRNKTWPLLIESRMSGIEISFTILVDGNGAFQILPTSMDYPERFEGQASARNPITGGMGSISPHPFESGRMMEMAKETIALPLINALKEEGLLRPCILYPGCFVSLEQQDSGELKPSAIRVCEINIRPGEPEFQTVVRRLKNPGELFNAMFTGDLDKVVPEVRKDQISVTTALVTGPGGPDGQKGYPWGVTRNEKVDIDFAYMRKKGLQVIPSAMGYTKEKGLVSDGTRVAYLIANGSFKNGASRQQAARKLMNKTRAAWENGKIRVVPREDASGNRLDMRKDIGSHFAAAESITR